MRHLKQTAKLGRTSSHRNQMLANMVCSLIKHRRITTTLAKAKAAQRVAERMVTLGKRGNTAAAASTSATNDAGKATHAAENVHCRRLVAARLHQQPRSLFRSKEERLKWRSSEDVIHLLFEVIAPAYKDRQGGYTRIIKLAGARRGDSGQKALLEFVDLPAGNAGGDASKPATEAAAPAAGEKAS